MAANYQPVDAQSQTVYPSQAPYTRTTTMNNQDLFRIYSSPPTSLLRFFLVRFALASAPAALRVEAGGSSSLSFSLPLRAEVRFFFSGDSFFLDGVFTSLRRRLLVRGGVGSLTGSGEDSSVSSSSSASSSCSSSDSSPPEADAPAISCWS